MGRTRKSQGALALSRIYQKRNRYYLFWATPLQNPKTGKTTKWHSLCNVQDGMLKARTLAEEIISFNFNQSMNGDMSSYLQAYLRFILLRRERKKPSEPDKLKMFLTRNNDLKIISTVLEKAFIEFNVSQVLPKHIAFFLDSKEATPRMAQVYRSYLFKFFQYSCRKGWCHLNPVDNVRVETPEKRSVYLSDDEFLEIRKKILIGKNGNTIRTGQMILAYVDLCYLTSQRTTEIRLLKWSQISNEAIYFQPTKTFHTSNADVLIPLTPQIKAVLEQIKGCYGIQSDYVIHTQQGTPFTASGLRSAWNRALRRIGMKNITLRDLRPKAITDAVTSGFELKQVSIAAAHTQTKTTTTYVKLKETPRSEIQLEIPKKQK